MIVIENNLLMLALVIPLMALLAYAGLQVFRLLFRYEITNKDIVVYLFHFLPIYRVPFNKIVAIHNRPLHEVMLVPGVHLFTRPFARNVVIEQKDRWFIFAFLTPENPDAFIAEVKKRMAASN
jgi:hypothetical protein